MSPRFITGRRSALIARQRRTATRRRRAVIVSAVLILVPGLLLLYTYHRGRSWIPPAREKREGKPDFDPQLVYVKARALLEKGKSNEHRGRRDGVRGQYEESLELMLMISEGAPEYRPDQVQRDIDFLRGKLRRVR